MKKVGQRIHGCSTIQVWDMTGEGSGRHGPHSFIVASLVLFIEAAESIATLVIRSPETAIAPGNR